MSFSQIVFSVKSEKNPHAELFTAYADNDTLTFTLSAPMTAGMTSPYLELTDGYELSRPHSLTFPFLWEARDRGIETYRLKLSLERLRGLYFASILFDTCEGRGRLSYDPTSYRLKLSRASEPYEPFGLTVYESDYATPDWFKGGILYQIFVDRFAKGSRPVPTREDAVLNPDWENGIPKYPPYRGAPLDNNEFFGGTLYGVAEKLDYLASLGVTAIYLCPIFKAYSNHKYDTGDYMRIDEMFGGEEAFDLLLTEAKKRNIGIILDGVFNHTGDDSRYFNRYGKYDTLGAFQSKDSPWAAWYDFEEFPNKYRAWWGIDILPSVNTDEPSYREFICGEEGVIRKYLKKGVSGWRLDVADELSEGLIRAIRTACRREKEDALLLGEVWEDASDKIAYGKRRSYFAGSELDSVMNYPTCNAIVDYILTGDSHRLFATVKRLYSHYPKSASDTCMNFLGTHDTERILTRLSGVGENGRSIGELAHATLSEEERALAKKRLRTAWFLLTQMPGVPCIYYGDEAGMEGYHDPFNRRPYPWGREDSELVDFYRTVGQVRLAHKVYAKGFMKLAEGLPDGIFAMSRFDENECLTAVVNRSGRALTLDLEALLPEGLAQRVDAASCRAELGASPENRRIFLQSDEFSLIAHRLVTKS